MWRCSLDAELGADRAHVIVQTGDRAAARPGKREAGATIGEQGLRCLRYPDAMARAVFCARPNTRHRLARHLPPAIDDVLAAHVGNFAWTLTTQPDHFQRRAAHRIEMAERLPKQRHFRLVQYAFAAARRVALDQPCGICRRDDFLANGPTEKGADRG